MNKENSKLKNITYGFIVLLIYNAGMVAFLSLMLSGDSSSGQPPSLITLLSISNVLLLVFFLTPDW